MLSVIIPRNKKDIQDKYCYRQAEMGVGDVSVLPSHPREKFCVWHSCVTNAMPTLCFAHSCCRHMGICSIWKVGQLIYN